MRRPSMPQADLSLKTIGRSCLKQLKVQLDYQAHCGIFNDKISPKLFHCLFEVVEYG